MVIFIVKMDIEGKLNGIIEVDELLSLKSTAKLQGEISPINYLLSQAQYSPVIVKWVQF